jgi:hypothetical protein
MIMPVKMRFAVTGATGLVGKALCAILAAEGHQVWALTRTQAPGANSQFPIPNSQFPIPSRWHVDTGQITTPEPTDVLVHLAGRNVGTRWSPRVKREIWDSRVPATRRLCASLARLPAQQRPRVLIAASAIGIYGDRGDEVLTETSAVAEQGEKGQSFLADLCRAWEAATQPATDAGIRVVNLRLGIVLSSEGGALAKLATPVKWGLGGPIGPGTQFLPWISRTDLCQLILRAAADDQVRGIINGVGPAPVRQHEFIRTLGHVLRRPTIFPLPSFMVKLAFGQMGAEMLLASQCVIATNLPTGFAFAHGTLEEALRAELGVGL